MYAKTALNQCQANNVQPTPTTKETQGCGEGQETGK